MPDLNIAAFWSAVAASFAALSSFLIMRIQRRNLLESVRPELVLDGWQRAASGTGETHHDVVAFTKVRNVGRGAALHVHINATVRVVGQGDPEPAMGTVRVPILPTNDAASVDGSIRIWFREKDPRVVKSIKIVLLSWDSGARKHETIYDILVAKRGAPIGFQDEVAERVSIAGRRTTDRPVWALKLLNKLRRIPGIGRLSRRLWPSVLGS